MSLLREIQEAAIDAKLPLATLLRKCKVLGARLGNGEFKEWVENELNGYTSTDDLPEYRVLLVNSSRRGQYPWPLVAWPRACPLYVLSWSASLRRIIVFFSEARTVTPNPVVERTRKSEWLASEPAYPANRIRRWINAVSASGPRARSRRRAVPA
jgi:hypothetical protein